MKIIFDARHLQFEFTGLARYTYGLLNAAIDSSFESLVIILSDSQSSSLEQDILRKIEKRPDIRIVLSGIRPFSAIQQISMSRLVNKLDGEIYIYPHFDAPLFVKKHTHIVIHDLFPLILPQYFIKFAPLKKFIFWLTLLWQLKRSNVHIHAVSQSTRDDIGRFYGERKVDVIGAAPHKFLHMGTTDAIELPQRYLLYIGDRRPHKNLKRMVDIFKALRSTGLYDGDFVIAGSHRNFDFDLDEYVNGCAFIRTIGNVDDLMCVTLYRNADALFFLTQYEGFGMPVAEAICHGVRVITSDIGATAEFNREGVLLLSPNIEINTENLQKFASFIQNAPKPRQHQDEFTWGRTWSKMQSAIQSLIV